MGPLRRFGLCAIVLLAAGSAAAESARPILPWVRLVPPDHFCVRFGTFGWIGYLRDTDALARRGDSAGAAERERALGEALWYLGRGTGRICSCGSKEAVLADLKRMLPELKRRPGIAYQDTQAAARVEGVIAGIEADGVAVVPPAHAGCVR